MPDGGSAESRERKRRFQQIQICLPLSQPVLLPELQLLLPEPALPLPVSQELPQLMPVFLHHDKEPISFSNKLNMCLNEKVYQFHKCPNKG